MIEVGWFLGVDCGCFWIYCVLDCELIELSGSEVEFECGGGCWLGIEFLFYFFLGLKRD